MTGFKTHIIGIGRRLGLGRFHRDERGAGMFEYALVFAAVAVPIMALFVKLFDVLADYFGMIAFFVSWPFI
jgi:Flp pilus assembly pilin Flp